MSDRQILYEAKLAKEGRKLTRAGLVVLVFWAGLGLAASFAFDSFPSNIPVWIVVGIGAVSIALLTDRVFHLRHNPGVYRIAIDNHGLYVHSDDPSSAPSFSIIAPDLYRLVRKTIKQYDSSDDHEYYVETRSGTRHRIEQLFADYNLDVMKLFEKIINRFPWVQILEEINQ
jgi:hypothetical protein